MKHLPIHLAITVALLLPHGIIVAQNSGFHFRGELKTWGDTLVVMQTLHSEHSDTIIRQNGMFDFSLPIHKPTLIDVVSLSALRNINHEQIGRFPAIPGESLEYAESHLAGSPFYQEYEKTLRQIERPDDGRMTRESINAYALAHSDTENAVFALSDWSTSFLLTSDEMLDTYKKLSPAVQNGRLKDYFYELVESKHDFETREREAKESEARIMNQLAPDFSAVDMNGRSHRLSDYRGKYVLLDFWGSWCRACVGELPRLKEYAAQYQDKMTVIGLACKDKADSWVRCIEKFELPWLNLMLSKDSRVEREYGIIHYPTKILITPDGKVMKAPRGYAIYEFIDELFSQRAAH